MLNICFAEQNFKWPNSTFYSLQRYCSFTFSLHLLQVCVIGIRVCLLLSSVNSFGSKCVMKIPMICPLLNLKSESKHSCLVLSYITSIYLKLMHYVTISFLFIAQEKSVRVPWHDWKDLIHTVGTSSGQCLMSSSEALNPCLPRERSVSTPLSSNQPSLIKVRVIQEVTERHLCSGFWELMTYTLSNFLLYTTERKVQNANLDT